MTAGEADAVEVGGVGFTPNLACARIGLVRAWPICAPLYYLLLKLSPPRSG
jgi:hypothetical protein